MWLSWQHQIAQDWLISKVEKGGEQSQASVSLAGMFWGTGARLDPLAFFLSPQLGTAGLSCVLWGRGGLAGLGSALGGWAQVAWRLCIAAWTWSPLLRLTPVLGLPAHACALGPAHGGHSPPSPVWMIEETAASSESANHGLTEEDMGPILPLSSTPGCQSGPSSSPKMTWCQPSGLPVWTMPTWAQA